MKTTNMKKADLQKELSRLNVPFTEDLTVPRLKTRMSLASIRPENASRDELEKLTVPQLRELLEMNGRKAPSKMRKPQLIEEASVLNPSTLKKKEEETRLMDQLPLDVLRKATETLPPAERMRAAMAFGDRQTIKSIAKETHKLIKLTYFPRDGTPKKIETDPKKIRKILYAVKYWPVEWYLETPYADINRIGGRGLTYIRSKTGYGMLFGTSYLINPVTFNMPRQDINKSEQEIESEFNKVLLGLSIYLQITEITVTYFGPAKYFQELYADHDYPYPYYTTIPPPKKEIVSSNRKNLVNRLIKRVKKLEEQYKGKLKEPS